MSASWSARARPTGLWGALLALPALCVVWAASGSAQEEERDEATAAPPAGAEDLEEGEVLLLDDADDDTTAIDDGEEIDLSGDDDNKAEGEDGEGTPGADGSDEEAGAWDTLAENMNAFLEGNWLDPPGEFWAVRRGSRLELGFFIGGEAAAGKIQPGDILVVPDIGGVVLSPVFRWYPVDQVAIVMGLRGYVGIAPAVGTGAQTVLTPYFGVRYDLVKESRLSILIDVYSGPAGFLFASLVDPSNQPNQDLFAAEAAIGAEIAGGIVGRYSLGPTTFELRGTLGGRAGSAQVIGREGSGPFSALYAGLDLGITWSFLDDGLMPKKPADEREPSGG